MVKFDLERGQEVARCREVAYKEGAHRRDYCIINITYSKDHYALHRSTDIKMKWTDM